MIGLPKERSGGRSGKGDSSTNIGIYSHISLNEQNRAIASLLAPPQMSTKEERKEVG
jgi:hypothetical protein